MKSNRILVIPAVLTFIVAGLFSYNFSAQHAPTAGPATVAAAVASPSPTPGSGEQPAHSPWD